MLLDLDLETLSDLIVQTAKDAVAPFQSRIAALEAELVVVREGRSVDLDVMTTKVLAHLPSLRDEAVSRDVIALMVGEEVTKAATTTRRDLLDIVKADLLDAVQQIPMPRDGKDGAPGEKGLDGQPGRDGVDGVNGRDGLDGKDGSPGEQGEKGDPGDRGPIGVTGEQGLPGERGEKGAPGERGADGVPGPAGEKGIPGLVGPPGERGAIGEKGLNGLQGERGPEGPVGREGSPGRDGLPGVPGAAGEKGMDGVHGKDGAPGKDGRDGSLEPLTMQFDGERTVTFCFKDGTPMGGGVIAFPMPIYRGVYVAGKAYAQGDSVTFGGSQWIAREDTSAKPGDGATPWQLAVKVGRDGREGKPGKDGTNGRDGKDGKPPW